MDTLLTPEFWKNKKLEELTDAEWEALCDRCGKCCLQKVTEGKNVLFLNSACPHLRLPECRCRIYKCRLGENCVKVDLRLLEEEPELLPDTCAYKRLYRGEDLPDWHPLVSGNPESVRQMGQKLDESILIPYKELMTAIAEEGGLPLSVFPIEVVKLD